MDGDELLGGIVDFFNGRIAYEGEAGDIEELEDLIHDARDYLDRKNES